VTDVVEFNEWTQQNVTGNYQQLLEQVPTFFNDFIPRGLFYDLTDADIQIENGFDRIKKTPASVSKPAFSILDLCCT